VNIDNPASVIAYPIIGNLASAAPAAAVGVSARTESVASAVRELRALLAITIPQVPLHRLGASSVAPRFSSLQPSLTTIEEQAGDEVDLTPLNDQTHTEGFWVPSNVWRSITAFSSRREVLNLRATNRDLYAQADQALTTITLLPSQIGAFINSPGFNHIKALCIEHPDDDSLTRLSTHLEAHPRRGLTLTLSSDAVDIRDCDIGANSLVRLMGLPLTALHIDGVLGFGSDDALDALATCPFPIDLAGGLSRGALVAASRIAQLRALAISGMAFDDTLARMFSTHPSLEAISVGASRGISSAGVIALASIPTLRTLCVDLWTDIEQIDAASASAIAANATLATLKVTEGQGLSEESFAALSRSQSLTTLHVRFREGMLELGNITSLRHLAFTPSTWAPPIKMDAVSAASIARLPALETITLPNMTSEPGALTAIFKRSPAHTITFEGNYDFDQGELAALQANTHVRALIFKKGSLRQGMIDAMCRHPTLERVCIMRRELHRIPGQALLTDVSEMADAGDKAPLSSDLV